MDKTPINGFDDEYEYLEEYRNNLKNGKITVNYVKEGHQTKPKNPIAMCQMREPVMNTIINENMICVLIKDSILTILNILCDNERFLNNKIKTVLKNKLIIVKNIMDKYDINIVQAEKILFDIINIKNIDNYDDILNVRIDNNTEDKLCDFLNEVESVALNYFSKKYVCIFSELNLNNNQETMDIVQKRKLISDFLIGNIVRANEYNILNVAFNSIFKNTEKINTAILQNDCIFIEKSNFNNDLLEKMSNAVKRNMKFDIKFAVKPINPGYDLSNIEYTTVEDKLYEDYKTDFEKNYFILNPFKYCNIKNGKITIVTSKEFRDYAKSHYANDYFNFYDKWFCDKNKKIYDDIVFEPNLANHKPENYNLYDGFKYEILEKNNLNDINIDDVLETSFFMKVLKNSIPDENEYTFLINWIAHIVQLPYQKTRKCIVMYGERDENFELMVNFLLKLFDKYGNNININNIDDNEVFINNIFMYGYDNSKNNKKNIFEYINCDRIEQYKIDKNNVAYSNFFIQTSNLKNAVKLIGDINYFVINHFCVTNDDLINLNDELNDENMLCKVFQYFKNYNISKNIFYNVPITNSQINLKNKLIPPFLSMINDNFEYYNNMSLTSEQIFNNSLIYINTKNYDLISFETHMYKYTDTLCIRDISSVFSDIKRRNKKTRYYEFSEFNNFNNFSNFKDYIELKITKYFTNNIY